jgi:hypothetical protein
MTLNTTFNFLNNEDCETKNTGRDKMQRQSLCEKINYYIWNVVSGIIGGGSSVTNAQYAMSVIGNTAPNALSAQWLFSLNPGPMIGSLYAGASTLGVSGTFGYRFFKIARLKLLEELQLFRQGKNTKRFLIETTMAFLCAITGGVSRVVLTQAHCNGVLDF